MDYKLLTQIVLNVTLISVFIGVFFFTYGKQVEKKIITEQTGYIATSLAEDLGFYLNESTKNQIKSSIVTPVEGLEEEDKKVQDSNNVLQNKAILALGILFLIGFSIVIFLREKKLTGEPVIYEGFIILLFVGFTEFIFFNLIARKYRVADPNFVKETFLKTIKDNI
jgi:hypothetical protein